MLSNEAEVHLPDHPEVVSIEMPRLYCVFVVLEDNFEELMKVGRQDRGGDERRTTGRSTLERTHTKDSSDVEVVSELERGIGINVGCTVNGVPLLPIDKRSRVGQHDRPGWSDLPVMERPLRVRSCCIRCQIPPAGEIRTDDEDNSWMEKLSKLQWLLIIHKPVGSCLLNGPVDFDSRASRNRAGDWGLGV